MPESAAYAESVLSRSLDRSVTLPNTERWYCWIWVQRGALSSNMAR